ncbi:probable ATP-dependent RNA helicase DDX31 isoform X2 [Entelurus aequoreus]|uniref:probable ATP-dependent RNA helicase DDX31 isoform X2 n=1 Tax=Entelurus aequoreus TaxID=161455 RepID=UPI002B1D2EC5|nr:probable ATP-dependent RNA helicase DDX31 isoform X2 [Entelurus aequoreus]
MSLKPGKRRANRDVTGSAFFCRCRRNTSSTMDDISINIGGPSPPSSFPKRISKTAARNHGAKRKLTSADERRRGGGKRARLQEARHEAEAPPPQTHRKSDARTAIKTSSLFKHNPDIPRIDRADVSQLTEKIFTSDSFSDLNLHPHLVATLNKVLNVSTLTSVQKQTIPALLSGRDAVVRSQTGSGKTLSFAIPLVQSLQALEQKVCRSDGPLAVVIVPTRELALQTFHTFQKLLKPFMWIVPGVLMGGEKRKSEKARLRKGINILVSTPGRLVDHIQHTLSIAFSAVRWLVLDEADRILDMGFEKDLSIILNSLNSTGPSRQNVLLSATLTHGVTRLTDVCLNEPISIHLSEPAPSSDLAAVTPEPSAGDQSESFAVPSALKQFVVVVPSKVRLVCLAAFVLDKCQLSEDHKVMVFVSSCEEVDFLHSILVGVLAANQKPPPSFLRLHGNMQQEERSEVWRKFSSDARGVLLCTDVAARGLDLPQVTWILQYTPPSTAVEYVHRVGRTARIGAGGSSLLLLTPAESAFISELANHNISLAEMQLLDILSSLMRDNTYKGRGKYHSKTSTKARDQDMRERATVLQTHFENFVHANATSLQNAKKALQSYLRAYTSYPAHLKHVFHIRALHLGHAAKSFGLRDAPRGLSATRPPRKEGMANARRGVKKAGVPKKFFSGHKNLALLRAEFSSGLDAPRRRRRRRRRSYSDHLRSLQSCDIEIKGGGATVTTCVFFSHVTLKLKEEELQSPPVYSLVM